LFEAEDGDKIFEMTSSQTVSWIFLATALASQTAPASFDGISQIADGINHAIPTQTEMRTSLDRLKNIGLVEKTGKKYVLTEKGKAEYQNASVNSEILFEIWEALETILNDKL
jgi:hypothetical protein